MSDYKDDVVTIADVSVEYETEKSLLCMIDGEKIWIPKSQIHDDSEVYKSDTEGFLVITKWFASKEGLE